MEDSNNKTEASMDWYYVDGEKQVGPVAQDAMAPLVRSGTLTSSTPVWHDGMADWIELGHSELASLLAAPPPVSARSVPPTYAPRPTVSQAPPSTSFARDPQRIYPKNPPRSPHVCWWGLLVYGLPQMIHGQVGKAILVFVVGVVAAVVTSAGSSLIAMPLTIIDAYMVGKVLQSGRSVGKMEFFPK